MSLSTTSKSDVPASASSRHKRLMSELDEWEERVAMTLAAREAVNFDEFDEFDDDSVMVSTDLTEATYSFSFDLLEENNKFLDKTMSKNPLWECFGDLFKINKREIDLTQLIRDGYYEGEEKIISSNGAFMGDPLAFIHLTLTMLSSVEQASVINKGYSPSKDVYRQIVVKRPFGQSVGDDMLILRVSRKFAIIFQSVLDDLGLRRSKIDSISEDTATFCEQYIWRLPKKASFVGVEGKTVFGDLVFLDCIKGSVLSGQAKVKSDGASPYLGHAKLLQKQIAYLPSELEWRGDRAKLILWSRNFRESHGMTEALPGLPRVLGGLDLAVGRTPDLRDERLAERYWPYLYRLIDPATSQGEALEVITLLDSIWKTSNKGFNWESLEIDVFKVVQGLKIIGQEEAWSYLPPKLGDRGPVEKLEWLNRHVGLVSLWQLADELLRRHNFLKWWKGELPPKKIKILTTKEVGDRHREVWSQIRSRLKPMERPFWVTSVKKLADSVSQITFGNYFHREDPQIRAAFEGMPSLYFRL